MSENSAFNVNSMACLPLHEYDCVLFNFGCIQSQFSHSEFELSYTV